jgi:para-aminobenzoate synthetase component I
MLEIHEPEGAFERVEAHLRAAGFFDGGGRLAAGLCADLYLGYGLSRASRRTSHPDPPEIVALPLAACRIREAGEPPPAPGRPLRLGDWLPSWSPADHVAAVRRVQAAIAAGEVYQVNLVQHLAAPFEGTPGDLAACLAQFRPLAPRPFIGDGWSIVSASPELFLARKAERLWTMPIKGTRPLGGGSDLRASVKDAAEHVMIVDLERNDLGRVCEPGSLRWPELMAAHELAGVVHLVSTVEGRPRRDASFADLLAGLFPGGSVTGAPKIAAIDHIARLEPVGRGASMGALGVVHPNGDFELALTIRTFVLADGRIHLWVGGGIVWDSLPEAEVEESWVKARPLLDAIGSRAPARVEA